MQTRSSSRPNSGSQATVERTPDVREQSDDHRRNSQTASSTAIELSNIDQMNTRLAELTLARRAVRSDHRSGPPVRAGQQGALPRRAHHTDRGTGYEQAGTFTDAMRKQFPDTGLQSIGFNRIAGEESTGRLQIEMVWYAAPAVFERSCRPNLTLKHRIGDSGFISHAHNVAEERTNQTCGIWSSSAPPAGAGSGYVRHPCQASTETVVDETPKPSKPRPLRVLGHCPSRPNRSAHSSTTQPLLEPPAFRRTDGFANPSSRSSKCCAERPHQRVRSLPVSSSPPC